MAMIDARPGRVRPAPENFLTDEQIAAVKDGRRDFLRKAFLTASVAMAAPAVARAAVEGDPAILELPQWSTTLGLPVAANPYGMPSQYERGLQRRVRARVLPGSAARRWRSRRCRACSASSPRRACTSSATTRAGATSTRRSTA